MDLFIFMVMARVVLVRASVVLGLKRFSLGQELSAKFTRKAPRKNASENVVC